MAKISPEETCQVRQTETAGEADLSTEAVGEMLFVQAEVRRTELTGEFGSVGSLTAAGGERLQEVWAGRAIQGMMTQCWHVLTAILDCPADQQRCCCLPGGVCCSAAGFHWCSCQLRSSLSQT